MSIQRLAFTCALVALVLCCHTATRSAEPEYSATERAHWSLLPRTNPPVPQFTSAGDRDWVRTPVDAFVLAKLREKGLSPAPEASRATLARRVYFDLMGLPPSPEELAEFARDASPDAYEQLVDRLLASPRYGERWGQHWLDVVRFAETEGFEYDRHRTGAWRYRDYVIAAFNADKPFDRFALEQLAGDELAAGSPRGDDLDLQVAAGFHRLGPIRRNAGNLDVAFSRNEVLTEMTDVVGAAFLGLTLGCARCHDHMFDPIRQRDYYQLQAFLAATHEHDLSLADESARADWQARTEKASAAVKQIKDAYEKATGEARKQLEQELAEAEKQVPPPLDSVSTVRNVAQERSPIHVLARGAPEKRGEEVAPRPLGVLLPEGAQPMPADMRAPRTALARWIASPEHPLTARVLANRVWQHHFGQGLVRTANDFGVNGDAPSHGELLDYLANELVRRPASAGNALRGVPGSARNAVDSAAERHGGRSLQDDSGWSLKSLHRAIVLSSTYRQASQSPAAESARRIDPQNRLLGRFPRRRLSAEELRDAMLAVSGRLNPRQGGPSIMVPVERELVNLLYKPSQWEVAKDESEQYRRSVYLLAKRNLRLPFLEVFDRPDLQTSCPRREASTHAPQALELLNGPFSNALAEAFAARLRAEAGNDPTKQIELAFTLVAGRSPTSDEARLSREFLSQAPLREFTLAMFNLNALMYVD